MMREKKKKAAVFLVICMVLSMFTGIPLNVSAQDDGKTELFVKDWIDWDDEGCPSLNENAEAQKESWADLYGRTLYLGYAESESAELNPVTKDQISIQYNEETAGEDKVQYNTNKQNSDLIDFTFYEVGDYTITYESSTVTIHVSYPEVGFYKINMPSSEDLIRDEEFKYTDGGDNKFYMIFHRMGWSKLDIEHIKYSKDGEEIADISKYFTIISPDELSLSDTPSDYLEEEDYVYEVQINENMNDSFWLDVEVQKTEISSDDDEEPSYQFADESYPIMRGIGISYTQKMNGLLIKDWIDWVDDYPSVNEEAEAQKETWADLYGSTLYLGYAESEGADLTTVTAEDISVQYDGEDVEDKVQYKANEENGDLIDFTFYKVGDYTVSYTNADSKKSSVTIHVDYPDVGFYETNEMTEAGFIRNISYERGTEKTFYAIPNVDENKSCTYKIMTEGTPEENTYINVDGIALNPNKEIDDKATVTITADAKGYFGLMTIGTISGEDTYDFDYYIPCEDIYEATIIEDGKEHNGFAGCFIPQELYDCNSYNPSLSDMSLYYWVHADTLQGVVDELVQVAEQDSVTVDGQTYTIENSGYIWVNVSYLPKYEANATATQYVTTPSDIEGIIVASNFEMYYTEEKDVQGSYYPVKLWKNGDTELYTCLKGEDGKYYPVTKTADNVFHLQAGGTGKTEEEMVQDGYTLDEEYGINCQWPELHVDATTNVKIIGDFAEAAAGRANVYLGLYEDSDIVSYIMVGIDEEEDIQFNEITKADIGKEVTTDNGLKVKVVKLTAKMDTTVVGNFISADAVTIEEEGDKALRDKIDIEEIIAGDEDLKKAIIDGESLDVSMNVKTIEKNETQATEGVDKISALFKTGKNDTSTIQYMDIGLTYQVGEKQGNITETKEDITISINLPQDFAKTHRELAKSWKPVVYRYHDGKAERLESTFEDGKLKFATGKFSVYAVAIEEVVPTDIKITTPPTKTSYMVGDTFDKTGMVVEALYSDDSSSPITDYTVSPAVFAATDKEVIISWHGKTAKQAVTVNAQTVTPEPPATTETPTTTETPVTPEPEVKVGDTITSGGNTYQITAATSDKKEVAYKSGNKKTKKVKIPSSVTIDGTSYKVTEIAANSFSGNKKITSVTIPTSIVKIGDNAFKNCTKLTKVTIPKNVTAIGKNAFSGCKQLKTITIKSTKLTTIGKNAFNGCKQLKTITIKSTKLKTIGKNAFKDISKKATIKVPKSKKKAYTNLLKKAGYKGKVK